MGGTITFVTYLASSLSLTCRSDNKRVAAPIKLVLEMSNAIRSLWSRLSFKLASFVVDDRDDKTKESEDTEMALEGISSSTLEIVLQYMKLKQE